jgi:hypothetical protein
MGNPSERRLGIMAENNPFDSRNNEQEEEQKEQFRSFVENVAGGSNGKNESIQDQSRTADEQNRMIDKHNLRK